MRRFMLVLVVAALAAAGVPMASPVAAAGSGRIVSVDMDPGPFVVAGFAGHAQAAIRVVLVDGSEGTSDWRYSGVAAVLERLSGGGHESVTVDLPRVATSGGIGTFSGFWRIASSRAGVWTLTSLVWDPAGGRVDPRIDPGVTRTVAVVATNPPTGRISTVPRALPYGSTYTVPMRVTATYRAANGAPLVGARVLVGTEYACFATPVPPTRGNGGWGFDAVLRTNALGQVSFPLSDLDACVFLLGPPAVAGDDYSRALVRTDQARRHYYYRWVSAAPTSRTVRVGRMLTVLGTASPATGIARLQRLVGRTWRTVSTARVRTSGRYTAVVVMPVRGRAYYRVVALDTTLHPRSTLVATASRAFLVTGVS